MIRDTTFHINNSNCKCTFYDIDTITIIRYRGVQRNSKEGAGGCETKEANIDKNEVFR